MPVAGIDHRPPELGRIRAGHVVATSGGRSRPAKLSTWRLTSNDDTLISAARDMYGGVVERWNDDGWQVVTDVDELDVVIPPQAVADGQWFEIWTAGGLRRRCDGLVATNDRGQTRECSTLCDPDDRECRLVTRIRFVLPNLPGVGVWVLTTGSYHAAAELPPVVDLLIRAAAPNLASAVLALEQRHVTKSGERHDFAVPTIRTRSTLRELAELAPAAAAPPALES